MQYSIDVIIPSFRLDEEILLKIFRLKQPINFNINFFLIADNPAINIPQSIIELINLKKINVLINEVNLGFSKTRNRGIEAGKGEWLLLLDDDIKPEQDLLLAYARAIENYPKSIGFVGITHFPKPFNNATKALSLNGSVSHFQSGLYYKELLWAPTANIMFNRNLLGSRRFLPELIYGGEDIELLFRNSLENGKKYRTVSDAIVTHPWWNNGEIQTKRMFRYGLGLSNIINIPNIKMYCYHDFSNTSETLLLLIFASLIFIGIGESGNWIYAIALIVLIAEFLTNIFRSVILSKTFSISLALQMMWHKNIYEAGYLWGCLTNNKIDLIAKRLDLSFNRPNPSPFRLNRWKIIKMSLILISVILLLCWF